MNPYITRAFSTGRRPLWVTGGKALSEWVLEMVKVPKALNSEKAGGLFAAEFCDR
jgi:hypothetical protein